jgi:hypothetical protein
MVSYFLSCCCFLAEATTVTIGASTAPAWLMADRVWVDHPHRAFVPDAVLGWHAAVSAAIPLDLQTAGLACSWSCPTYKLGDGNAGRSDSDCKASVDCRSTNLGQSGSGASAGSFTS